MVPRWGNYVGNGGNDAWIKADAALKTWPSLFPEYSAAGKFPRTGIGAAQASGLLYKLNAAEAKAGVGDPLHVGLGGDPEQKAAFDHDFEHGVAAAAHDLKGEVTANLRFAIRSEVNSDAAFRRGDLFNGMRDHYAGRFIGEGEAGLDRAVAGGEAVASAPARAREAVDGATLGVRQQALQAIESLKPH